MTSFAGPHAVDFYLLDQQLTPEELETRERVRAFAEREIVPMAQEYWERAEFPFELVPKLARLNIAGGPIHGYRAPGMSAVAYGLALQELAHADGGIATFVAVQSSLVMNAIFYVGTEEQRERWLPPLARFDMIGAFALTEPEAGSDAAALHTTAVRDGDSYVINGRKRWIGNATIADIVVVWARTEDGQISGFIVPRETPGYNAQRIDHKLSERSVWQGDIELVDVRVPLANRLAGMPGFVGAATTLTHARLGVTWRAIGQAIACYEVALSYARSRVQFGRPLAAQQLVQRKLVRMLNGITLAQLASLQLSRLNEAGLMTTAMVSLAKMNHTEMARQVALDARDILGANGILGQYQVMRHLADLEAAYTYEGTHDINMLIVGREITGLSAFK